MIGTNKYSLNDNEIEVLEKWLSKLPKGIQKEELSITYKHVGGVGMVIIAQKGVYRKNITDYGAW